MTRPFSVWIFTYVTLASLTACEMTQVRGKVGECVRYRENQEIYRIYVGKPDIKARATSDMANPKEVEFTLRHTLDRTFHTVDCP